MPPPTLPSSPLWSSLKISTIWKSSFLGLALLFSGCATTPMEAPQARKERASTLAAKLNQLAPKIPKSETKLIANESVEACAKLRENYQIRTNHNLHNLMVFWGLKQRGFCWHWRNDLQSALEKTAHPSFQFQRVWANPGNLWTEHHALVLTPKGIAWQNGLILDPWRSEGVLWFGTLKEDHYHWLEEPPGTAP